VLSIPVGVFQLVDQPFVPFEERRYDASFVGNPDAGGRLSVRARSRRDLLAAADAVRRHRDDIRLQVSTTDTLPWDLSDELTSTYARTMMQSRIALCPRGSSLETYRFFEALRYGCVPVTESLPKATFYDGSPAV